MGMVAVVQLGVDFIRENHDVGIPQHLGNGLQVLPLHHRAGGVAGEGHDEQLGLGGDGRLQLGGGEAELVFRLQRHRHRHAAGEGGDGLIAHKAGLGDDDLVAGGHQAADAHVNGLAAAHRDQDLAQRVVGKAEPPVHIGGDLLPQLLHTGVGGVAGLALLQALDARVPDAPGGLEVRLAHAQADAVVHFGGDVEKFTDARGPHFGGRRGNQTAVIHHSVAHSLSSGSSSAYITPSFL